MQQGLWQAAVLTDGILAAGVGAVLLSQGPAAHHAQEGGVAAWNGDKERDPSGPPLPAALSHCCGTWERLQLNSISFNAFLFLLSLQQYKPV